MAVEVPDTYADVPALVNRYLTGEITADDYFGAIEVYARRMVEQEVRELSRARRRFR